MKKRKKQSSYQAIGKKKIFYNIVIPTHAEGSSKYWWYLPAQAGQAIRRVEQSGKKVEVISKPYIVI